jgi:hypothetical protein
MGKAPIRQPILEPMRANGSTTRKVDPVLIELLSLPRALIQHFPDFCRKLGCRERLGKEIHTLFQEPMLANGIWGMITSVTNRSIPTG